MNGISDPIVRLRAVQGLQHQTDGTVIVNILANFGVTTYTPNGPRPCVDGDVLSVQPDGSFQGRVAGTNGAYERAIPDGAKLWFRYAVVAYREGLPD